MMGRPQEILANDPNSSSVIAVQQRKRFWEYLVPSGVKSFSITNPWTLILKLFGAGGVQIPANSKIFLAGWKRGEHSPVFFAEIPYAPYFNLSVAEQYNKDFQSKITHIIREQAQGQGYTFTEGDRLVLYVVGGLDPDLTQAGTTIQFTGFIDN